MIGVGTTLSVAPPSEPGHCDHAQSFILTTQGAIQCITQLRAIALIGLLFLASLTHRLGHHHQVFDSQLHQLAL
jgi:hypothetical protein